METWCDKRRIKKNKNDKKIKKIEQKNIRIEKIKTKEKTKGGGKTIEQGVLKRMNETKKVKNVSKKLKSSLKK